ncbi:hypothetical protein EG68_12154 [Paragonimus skrjabini miyazakii]|uniref:R3H-associated N-terminal domain-containing protein n=1 Tax=Paragonimus skrjabini miyazakii TaxID=59628 RepID=A0A8S9YG72_9TREM|nr:hypothetical protein EG68_12154 [Paragonimus skrjabini miyazakii]
MQTKCSFIFIFVSPAFLSSAALDCQSLSHYSDFDNTSESSLSDLSYVHPYAPKKHIRRAKSTPGLEAKVTKRGARATRRRENEAFLNTLSVIAETDAEDAANTSWPDSINHQSAFAKLFEDEKIRAVWDVFINLSEVEQARLLNSLRRSQARQTNENGSSSSDSDATTSSDEEFHPSMGTARHRKPTSHTMPSNKHPKRGYRRGKSSIHPRVSSLEQGDTACDSSLVSASLTVPPSQLATHAKLQDCLPPRFLGLLCRSANVVHGRGRQSRRTKRVVTPLDFCLINRVESELRSWFSSPAFVPSQGDYYACWLNQKRWTPTISLLSELNLGEYMTGTGQFPDPLRLDGFERLIIHSVAGYLGLSSYSSWSETLGDRQLWVEQRYGRPFQPPPRTLVNMIESHFGRAS